MDITVSVLIKDGNVTKLDKSATGSVEFNEEVEKAVRFLLYVILDSHATPTVTHHQKD